MANNNKKSPALLGPLNAGKVLILATYLAHCLEVSHSNIFFSTTLRMQNR